jgi:hypothetical protein
MWWETFSMNYFMICRRSITQECYHYTTELVTDHYLSFDCVQFCLVVYEGRLKSSSELYGGAVTVSPSKYLPWQTIHFLQRSTHFSKTCCRPLITSKFLASELPFHSWKSPEIAWERSELYGGCSDGVPSVHVFQAERRFQF